MGDTNLAACATLQAFTPACSVLTPGFQTITNPVSQAECFCYNQGKWNPNFYDGYYLECLSYYATATPAVLTSLASAQGGTLITAPCHALGDFKTPVAPTPTTTDPGLLACASVDGHFVTCYSKTPGFSTIVDATRIAECLCYSDLSWQPNVFDDPWTSCASYLSTASPAAFSAFVGSVAPSIPTAPCGDFGDVLHTTPPTPGPSPNNPSPTPTPVNPGPAESSKSPDPAKPSSLSTPEPETPSSISSSTPASSSISSEPETIPDPSSADNPNTSPTPTPGPLLPSFLRSSSNSGSGPPPTILSNTNNPLTNTNCAAIESLQESCVLRSSAFSTITDFRTAASCLCYSGIVWQPTVYDNFWSGCASYLSTVFSGEYSLATASVGAAGLASFAAPCSFVGDVLVGSRTTVVVTPSGTGAGAAQTSSKSAGVRGLKCGYGFAVTCALVIAFSLV